VIALPEHLFIPPNTPTIKLQTCPFQAQTICLDSTGAESTDDPLGDVEAAVRIMDIDDEHLNDDIETEVLHMQGLSKNRTQLDTWRTSQNIEYCPSGLWWKDQALVVVGNDDLKRGVTSKFHDTLMAGHPGIAKTTAEICKYYLWPGI